MHLGTNNNKNLVNCTSLMVSPWICVLSNVCVSSPGDTSNPGAWAEFRAAGADIWVQANAAAASEAAVGSGEQAKGRPRWAQAQIRQGAREPEEQLLCRDGQTCQEAPDVLGERCTWQPYHSIPKHYLFLQSFEYHSLYYRSFVYNC